MITRNKWIRIGCFLTGYNFGILTGSSETSVKRVLRYTSAMLIICILWAFIGYTFTDRYLKAEWYTSIFGSILMVVIVIQIERQVILSYRENRAPLVFRAIIALTMGLIGSIIIDQIIFKEDIEQQKTIMMSEKVNKVFPARASELKRQVAEIDSTIANKESERRILVNDISAHPTITVWTENITRSGMVGVDTLQKVERSRTRQQIENPKIVLLQPLDNQITGLRIEKMKKDSIMLELRPMVEAELKKNVGFLDELDLMVSILKDSPIALATWIIWFVLLFGLEVFILVSKWNEQEIDYDAMLKQQMELHLRRIELLKQQSLI